MRIVVKLDNKINKDEALGVLDQYADIIRDATGMECEFFVERHDFSYVPTVPDSDGDLRPTDQYRQELCKEVFDRYGYYGCDSILMWVHEDNFLFKGLWGVAWAYKHFKYNLLLCRWDKDNEVNTLNTLLHEGEHPHDTTIQKELGINITPLICNHFGYTSFNYDRDYVHGNHPDWKYIGKRGYTTDTRMLEFLAPYLRKAYKKRKEAYLEPYKKVQWKVIEFLRSLLKR